MVAQALTWLAPAPGSRHGSPMTPASPHNPPPQEARNVPDFSHVRDWIFDLDNTLYRADNGIFAQIDANMTRFVARLLGMERDAARQIQKQLYRDHGTTLAGLVAVHKIDPEPYLDFVHDIDLSDLLPDPDLRNALTRLPGRRSHRGGSTALPRSHADRRCNRPG